jgi:hypothetical protein
MATQLIMVIEIDDLGGNARRVDAAKHYLSLCQGALSGRDASGTPYTPARWIVAPTVLPQDASQALLQLLGATAVTA